VPRASKQLRKWSGKLSGAVDEGLKITLLEMPQRQALSKIMKPSKESVKRAGRKNREEEGLLPHNF
jgi:hypothetical protein